MPTDESQIPNDLEKSHTTIRMPEFAEKISYRAQVPDIGSQPENGVNLGMHV